MIFSGFLKAFYFYSNALALQKVATTTNILYITCKDIVLYIQNSLDFIYLFTYTYTYECMREKLELRRKFWRVINKCGP